jgi:hypothetical protein
VKSLKSGVDVVLTIFCDARHFSAKIFAFFTKKQCYDLIFATPSSSLSKKGQVFDRVLGETILKIITPVPGAIGNNIVSFFDRKISFRIATSVSTRTKVFQKVPQFRRRDVSAQILLYAFELLHRVVGVRVALPRQPRHLCRLVPSRVARFFLVQHTKTIKMYQIARKYTKCQKNIPNVRKIYQMSEKIYQMSEKYTKCQKKYTKCQKKYTKSP